MTTLGFDDPQALRRFWVGIFLDKMEEPDEETITAIRVTRPIEELLDALREDDPTVRMRAAQGLWILWHAEAGDSAERELTRATKLLERGNAVDALERFTDLIEDYPAFAEAYNKRATVYYLLGDYESSVTDCVATLRLNRTHFGAWHGLGLCYLRLEQFERAATAFRCAARIQPLAEENHRLIAYCKGKLAEAAPTPTKTENARGR